MVEKQKKKSDENVVVGYPDWDMIEPKVSGYSKKPEGIDEFFDMANIRTILVSGGFAGFDLPWGESSRLKDLGISRYKQTKFLDYLDDNPGYFKKKKDLDEVR